MWTNPTLTPLERPTAFAGREVLTSEEWLDWKSKHEAPSMALAGKAILEAITRSGWSA
jgi:hypothetical protein